MNIYLAIKRHSDFKAFAVLYFIKESCTNERLRIYKFKKQQMP